MKQLTLIAFATIALLLTGCTTTTENPESPFTVGIMLPQTGLGANLGKQMLQGINLAANDTGNTLRLIVEDDQCDANAGITAAKKLTEVDNVDAILGPICTVAILSSAQLIEESNTPRITTGLVLQKTAEAGAHHFAYLPEMKHQLNAIGVYASEHNLNTIGVIAIDDDLGRESMNELKSAALSAGITIIAEEYFVKTETDYRTRISKIDSENPDAIYIMGYVPQMIALVKQTNELGISTPMLTWSLFQDPTVLPLGPLLDSVTYTYPEDPRELPAKTTFKKRFKEAYGEEPSLYAANAYDSYRILADSVSACGKDRECILAKLGSVKSYEGVNGFITVDERGVGQRSEVSIKRVVNGTFATIG